MPGDLREAIATSFAGRYRVERELGRGGMATVYLVHDTRHDRDLALKVLHPQLAAFLGRERFVREIAVASRLTHPNILPLHDSGEADGLLFYLMPYVEGETLRDRMVKEHPLPLEEALRIARDIAAALAYAHDHNVVHRDIKPSNILLQAGAAIVADFGIARAIRNSVDTDALTDSGLVLGTPAYMSPEQASADEIDGRSDIYSLGCVLYEMLAGGPPFSGASGRTLLARHSLDPVPPLRTVRPSVPVAVERVVMRALEKAPADRFASAADFLAALRPTGSQEAIAFTGSRPRRWGWRRALLVGAALAAVGAGWMGWQSLNGSIPGARDAVVVDTSRYLVFPLAQDDASAMRFDATQMLQDALGRWGGISVVDQFQVRDALARHGRTTLGGELARRVARERGAGRYVRGEISRQGSSIRLFAALHDASAPPNANALASRSIQLAANLENADSGFAALAEDLIFRGAPPSNRADVSGTRSVPARQAFVAGQRALLDWNLERADSHFSAAVRHDAEYAQALLWSALVRRWSGKPVTAWRSAAERAAAGRRQMSERDQQVSDAIAAQGRGDESAACGAWGALADRYPNDFVPWFGLGDCQSKDSIVVPDRRSASGWRFRTGYHSALYAYQRALQLLPSIHEGLGANGYESLRKLFKLNPTSVRIGISDAAPTRLFVAAPAWQDDSLAFTPVPVTGNLMVPEATRDLAIRHQKELFREIANAWAVALPQSSTAVEALAFSMELLGQPGALQTLQRARSLASDSQDSVRLAAHEVWLGVRLSAPGDSAGLARARSLADSLLRNRRVAGSELPLQLASLAALTGQAALASTLAANPALGQHWGAPAPLSESAPRLLVMAAIGGSPDSLRALDARVDSTIRAFLAPTERRAAGLAWLARAATLAFPSTRLETGAGLVGAGDWLLDAMEALHRQDTLEARRQIRVALGAGPPKPGAAPPADALYPEAWLFHALGDDRSAIAWLDALLGSLYGNALKVSGDPVEAGPLVRAMALRAELASRVGDQVLAARWARTVVILWSDADQTLQPVVRRMKAIQYPHSMDSVRSR